MKKSSRSTTVRKQNLLRSVTEVRSGRMTTNGLFRLSSQTMTEVSQLSGRMRRNSYFIVRNDLRTILTGETGGTDGNLIKTYYHGENGNTAYRVNMLGDTAMSIGCKTFTGKAALALKAWAMHE
jgi:hypothetical protein